jgi:UDP-N-acetylmuramoyl-tripeptide--D-alanyl-D-alanine ligase
VTYVLGLLCLGAAGFANVRWLRVAQREHYLPGSVSRFDRRWTSSTVRNAVLRAAAFGCLLISPRVPIAVVGVAVASCFGPFGLSLRGRTSKLVWTRRLKVLASVTTAMQVAVLLVAAVWGEFAAGAAFVAFFSPLFVDIASSLTAPYEKRKAQTFVEAARKRLAMVHPTVVAITGSYGKTSTKQFTAHLVQGTKAVFATPASYNNRGGLSKAVNEGLTPGTDVFVAEMGTYGPGEIAELCEIFPPDIAVITAIGPVHLERFGSEEAIVTAKSEIFEKASICVLNVDDDRLAKVADRLESESKTVWRCGSLSEHATVRVVRSDEQVTVTHDGNLIFEGTAPNVPETNVACAVAVSLQLGVAPAALAERLPNLPVSQHRQQVEVSPDGVTIIDDTFDANPAGVRRALRLLADQSSAAKKVVVTPGMVELGREQAEQNKSFASEAVKIATDVVIVGRTNRAGLLSGTAGSDANVVTVSTLPDAVAWVREHVGKGDAVAYINDLPDHFP